MTFEQLNEVTWKITDGLRHAILNTELSTEAEPAISEPLRVMTTSLNQAGGAEIACYSAETCRNLGIAVIIVHCDWVAGRQN